MLDGLLREPGEECVTFVNSERAEIRVFREKTEIVGTRFPST